MRNEPDLTIYGEKTEPRSLHHGMGQVCITSIPPMVLSDGLPLTDPAPFATCTRTGILWYPHAPRNAAYDVKRNAKSPMPHSRVRFKVLLRFSGCSSNNSKLTKSSPAHRFTMRLIELLHDIWSIADTTTSRTLNVNSRDVQ